MKMIGILSPEGKFYPCESFGHMELSDEICKSLNIDTSAQRGTAEDILLTMNYIIFRARDCYKNFFDENSNRIRTTDAQLSFMKKNRDNWNNDSQRMDVLDMLKYEGMLNDYYKEECDTD